MSADSRLGEYKEFCRQARALGGAVNLDEDNNASRFMDERGWTIHRQRAWIAILSGCHYDFIDFSILPGRDGQRKTVDGCCEPASARSPASGRRTSSGP